MKQFLYLLMFLQFSSINGQDILPGGVRGAVIWEMSSGVKGGQTQWISKLRNKTDTGLVIKGKVKNINNNPALLFSEDNNKITSTLDLGSIASFSLFTVCQGIDTITEKIILSLENDTSAEMVLTDRRMAALDIYRYASYNTDMKLFPKIYSYSQNKSNTPVSVSRRIQLGRPPRSQNIPAAAYNGIIPELIVYNRYISPGERQKVESYLALKYGISLNQEFPVSYLNSSGEVIWDAELNSAFSRNIAGIGRDDLSGLYQRSSESTQTPGMMKIAALNALENNSFLIWGDNGEVLRFDDESKLQKLKREWRVSPSNFERDFLSLEMNELSLSEVYPLSEGEIYWLIVDNSGTGRYPFGHTRFIQSKPNNSNDRHIKFDSVIFDADHSGSDLFTLLAASSFFARNTVISPTCSLALSGAIQTEIAGGNPPFSIILKGISNNSFQVLSLESKREHIFENISQGTYNILVTDADQKVFTENILVSNNRTWETSLCRSYKLMEGESLTLNASDGMPSLNYLYTWTTPDGSTVNNEEISIKEPGNYVLSVTDENNCSSLHNVEIKQCGKTIFKKVELFPNPVKGLFILRVRLERSADVKVIISELSGNIIKETLLQNDQYYLYNDILQKPGIYFVTLISDLEKVTLKLIVQ